MALPIGEMASRNSVPPPNSRLTATRPMRSSGFTRALLAGSTYRLVSRLQHLAQELSGEQRPGLHDRFGQPLGHELHAGYSPHEPQIDHTHTALPAVEADFDQH